MNKESFLKPGERLDDLQRNGLYIIQQPKGFCFGMDAVLLSGFAGERTGQNTKNILDLCTGNGIIPLLLSAKTDAKYIVGMEIQPDVAEMAKRSVKMNALDNKIEILTSDIKKAAEEISVASFDVVTVNPPYFKKGHGITNPNDTKTIARHEISCTLKDILEAASFALRPGGSLYMVHKPQRLTDVIYEMRSLRIEPKVLKLVYPYVSSEPSMFLIEGKKDGNPEIRIEKPLIIYGEDGNYTEEMYTIYGY